MFCVIFVIISKWGCSLLRYKINVREVVRVIDKFGSPSQLSLVEASNLQLDA